MQQQKVRQVFDRNGYNLNAFINRQQYIRILNSLMSNGQTFHEQVADQLWTQACVDRPTNQVKVSTLCGTILDAQTILKTRIYQIKMQLQDLEAQKNKLSKTDSESLQQIRSKINELQQYKQSFEQDYRLLTQPFGINQYSAVNSMQNNSINGYNAQESLQKTIPQSQQLKYLFYLLLIFGFLEIIMIYGKPDFLNLIVFTCLLSLFLMNFFDKVYIRLTLGLIVWLIMYAGTKWNPPTVANQSIYQIGYTRFIVFFTILLLPLKIGLIFLLVKFRNTEPNDKYIISLVVIKILVKGNNKFNPISKNLEKTAILSQ